MKLKTLSVAKHFHLQFPFIYSDMTGTASFLVPNKKSGIVKSIKWLLFVIFINFIMLYTLLTYTQKKID